MMDSPTIVLSVFKPVDLMGKLYFPAVAVCNLLVLPSQCQGGKAGGSELGHLRQEELGSVCTVGSSVLLPWLSCCQGNKPFKTRQVASTLSLVLKALLLGFQEWCLVKGSLPFLSKLLAWEVFEAAMCRLSGFSPRTVNGVDEACDLCTWFGVVLVVVCHPLSGLG